MAKMGRPTKRTPDIDRIVADALRLGLSYATAADLVGVTPETLRVWRKEDDDLSAACKAARAGGKKYCAGKLIEAVKAGNVTAIIFWLKTRTEEFREKKESETAATVEAVARALMALKEPDDGEIPSGGGDTQ